MRLVTVRLDDRRAGARLRNALLHYLSGPKLCDREVVVVCAGSAVPTAGGDCLGPLVGSRLVNTGVQVPVYGTLADPADATTIPAICRRIRCEHPDAVVIAVDAALGWKSRAVGTIAVAKRPIRPGSGVGFVSEPVGDMAIEAYLASIDPTISWSVIDPLFRIMTADPAMVFRAAEVISEALGAALGTMTGLGRVSPRTRGGARR